MGNQTSVAVRPLKTPAGAGRASGFRPSWIKRAWAGLAVGAAVVFLLPSLGFGFGYDHGILHYTAWAALHGRWPYLDTWETAFPGGILIHLAVIALGGTSVLAFRVVDLLVQAGIATLLYRLGRRLGGARAGLLASGFYALAYVAGGYYQTAQRDGFMVLPMLAGIDGLLRYQRQPARRWMALSGLAFGVMCLIRPTYGLLAAGLVVYALVTAPRRKLAAQAVDLSLAAALGLLPLAAFLGLYAARQALPELGRIAAYLAVIYPNVERASAAEVITKTAQYAPKIILLCAGLSLGWLGRRSAWQAYGLWVGAVGVLLLIRLWEAKAYPYQYWPVLACVAVLAGAGWELAARAGLRRLPWPSWGRAGVAGVALCATLASIYITNRGLAGGFTHILPAIQANLTEDPAYASLLADQASQAEVARYVREHTQAADLIQVWGPEAGVYYAAGRFAATRFPKPTALMCADLTLYPNCAGQGLAEVQAAWGAEFLADVENRQPKYIVAHYANGSLASDQAFSVAPDFPELRAILERDYQIETVIGPWTVFRRGDAL